MKIGTRSVLFGCHCFLIHPWFVALAWWKLYGFPRDYRLWIAFFLHDLGYWGKPDMDGDEGEMHPLWAASVMQRWFGEEWYSFCLYHSRFLAKRDGAHFSQLCPADKLSVALEPWWLYLPRAWISGELLEYMGRAGGNVGSKYNGEPEVGKYRSMNLVNNDPSMTAYHKIRYWHVRMTDYLRKWVYEHRDLRPDTWTPTAGDISETAKVVGPKGVIP